MSAAGQPPEGLSHLDPDGRARMVDVAGKAVSDRRAVAAAVVRMRTETARLLAEGHLPKGDAAPVARLAGIMAAKRTADLLPLCHQVALSSVDVELDVDVRAGTVRVRAEARAADRTGVEMEALVAASTAALAIYDMVKAVERGVVVERLGLEEKTGGSRGDWRRDAPPADPSSA